MEMIAMLGGLGAQPGFSPDGAAFASQISNAKSVAELAVIVTAIDSAALRPDERSALKVIAMEKKDSFDSIFRKPWYWVTVAAVLGVAWYHREKIKGALGLNGWSRSSPNFDFAAGAEKAKRMSDAELHYALLDIKKTIPSSRSLDREDGGDREGWYMDEASVYKAEIERRRKGLSGLSVPKSVEGIDKQGRKVRMTVKKDREWDEWQVRVYVDGKFSEDETGFFGQDKEDAINSFEDMKKTYGLAGLGAGWGSSDKHKINPGSRKGTAANPKAGYSRSFDPYAKEKELIGRMDDARYHARKKAKGLRRKARTEARKAGK